VPRRARPPARQIVFSMPTSFPLVQILLPTTFLDTPPFFFVCYSKDLFSRVPPTEFPLSSIKWWRRPKDTVVCSFPNGPLYFFPPLLFRSFLFLLVPSPWRFCCFHKASLTIPFFLIGKWFSLFEVSPPLHIVLDQGIPVLGSEAFISFSSPLNLFIHQ